MKFCEFGTVGKPTIMCLPGNFMTHRQFENIVPMLQEDYHIITVSFDGYDETGETTYTTGEDQANKLAAFIRENLGGKIDCVYAESLGSIPAAHLSRFPELQIGGIILSGAEYMNYGIFNSVAIKAFSPMTHKIMAKIQESGTVNLPKWLLAKMGRTNEQLQPMFNQMCKVLTLETTTATFWAAVTVYPEHISQWEPNTQIRVACWYGEKERNMKKAVRELKRAFPKLEVRPFKGLGHGEIMNHEELLVRELKAFIGR